MAKSWLQKYNTYEEVVTGEASGITSHAAGGQTNATALTKKFNPVNTNAADFGSVKLDSALTGKMQGVFNNTANILSVYPVLGQSIDGVTNYEFRIGPGDYVEFKSFASGKIKASQSSI